MRPPLAALLVSITDPDQEAVKLQEGWLAVLRLQFHDVDPVTFPGMNPDLTPMHAQHALDIVSFLSGHAGGASQLVVLCRAGVSRSGGVARAVAESFGLPSPSTTRATSATSTESPSRRCVPSPKATPRDELRPSADAEGTTDALQSSARPPNPLWHPYPRPCRLDPPCPRPCTTSKPKS